MNFSAQSGCYTLDLLWGGGGQVEGGVGQVGVCVGGTERFSGLHTHLRVDLELIWRNTPHTQQVGCRIRRAGEPP